MLELPEFVPGLATLNCTSIDMGRNVKSAVPPSRRPVGKPFLACAYVFIVSRRKIYKNQLIQDIIAEVRKTASYVNYNWRDA